MHLERFGTEAVHGIEFGDCVIMPKIDGTNGSVWMEKDIICAGSRTQQLSEEQDNQGFYQYVKSNENFRRFFKSNPSLRLYGEWLVPHTLKTYKEDVWRKFYVFDVFDDKKEKYLTYSEYQSILEYHGIDYIPATAKFSGVSYEDLLKEIEKNKFLIQEGSGYGEGIVIKDYNFKNKHGKTVFAKLVTNQFRVAHYKEMGPVDKKFKEMVEQEIVDKYVTEHLIEKVYAKIVNDCDGWSSKYISRLLNTVYYDLICEEMWDIVKKMKNPVINFKTLSFLVTKKIKATKPELF
jgi:hypothetical protein